MTALYACAVAYGTGAAQPVVALLVANSLMELVISVWLLFRFRNVHGGRGDIPRSGAVLVVIATVAALVTGLPALFLPQVVGHLLGYRVTEPIILTLDGAATCGYAAMGALELRSRRWAEMRLPVLMAMVFNGAGFLATVVGFLEGGPILLPAVVLVATVIVTPGAVKATPPLRARRTDCGRAGASLVDGVAWRNRYSLTIRLQLRSRRRFMRVILQL